MTKVNEANREVRVFRGKWINVQDRYTKELEKESDIKGTERYNRIAADIEQKILKEGQKLRENARNKLNPIYDACEKAIEQRYTKEPTQGMVNTLALLNMRQNISPTEIQMYLEKYADCPPAARVLIEKAESMHCKVYDLPTVDDMKHALETMRSNQLYFVDAYQGEDSVKNTPSLIALERYFRDETGYKDFSDVKSSQEADDIFWKEIIGIGSPEMFDEEGSAGKAVKVKYYFRDLDDLRNYIADQTEGLSAEEAEDKTTKILQNCPNQHWAAYNHFKATGEKYPLLQDGERLTKGGEIISE